MDPLLGVDIRASSDFWGPKTVGGSANFTGDMYTTTRGAAASRSAIGLEG